MTLCMNDFSAIGYLDYMWVISGGEDSMTGCYKYKRSSCLNIGCNRWWELHPSTFSAKGSPRLKVC